MILLSETFIYLTVMEKISRYGRFNDLSNEFKIIQLVNYICSEKNFQWKKEFLLVHMVWRWGNSFRPCYEMAKSVHNFDAIYHDVTPIKLDSRPHYELRSRNTITNNLNPLWIGA